MHALRSVIVFSVIAVLLLSLAGVGYAGMMDHGGGMIGCPLMGHDAAVCPMDAIQHASMWQAMFTAISVQNLTLALVLLIVLFFLSRSRRLRPLLQQSPQPISFAHGPETSLRDTLQRFIARGLLHPKTF